MMAPELQKVICMAFGVPVAWRSGQFGDQLVAMLHMAALWIAITSSQLHAV